MTKPPDERELDEIIKRQWDERLRAEDALPGRYGRRRLERVKQFILRRASAWREARAPIDRDLARYKPTDRELRDYCLAVADNPDFITSEPPLMIYFLAREFLKAKPETWLPQEIADLVDQLHDYGTDLADARHEVADLLGRERRAVAPQRGARRPAAQGIKNPE